MIFCYNLTDGMDSAYARIWNRRSLSKITHNSLSPEGMTHSIADGHAICFIKNRNISVNSDNVPFTSLSRGKHSSFAGSDVDWELV